MIAPFALGFLERLIRSGGGIQRLTAEAVAALEAYFCSLDL